MKKNPIFRAYDVRGKFPGEINQRVAENIGRALADFFKKGTLVLGFDARISSPELFESLKKGLTTNPKINFIEAGLITTPMLYFLVNQFQASGGVMVTASHNPKNFNGFKIVKSKALPVSGEEISKFYHE